MQMEANDATCNLKLLQIDRLQMTLNEKKKKFFLN